MVPDTELLDQPATDELPPVDDLPPIDDVELSVGSMADYNAFSWGSDLLYCPSQWFMMSEDIGIVNGERQMLVDAAKRKDEDAITKLEIAKQVVLEMMARTREDRHKHDSSGRPLFIGLDGKETIETSYRSPQGELTVFKRATERRSTFGIRKGREAQGGPGTPYIGEGYWKRMVEEQFYDLFPKMEFKKLKPDFTPKDYPTPQAMDYAKQQHAEKVANPNSAERKRLMRWLTPFLKNPVSKWTGED